MIKPVDYSEENAILEIIDHNKNQNMYFYINANTLGLKGEQYSTSVLIHNKTIKTLIYQYYDSLQLLHITDMSDEDAMELAHYIVSREIKRVSGNNAAIQPLSRFIMNCSLTHGHIMRYSCKTSARTTISEMASLGDLPEIAHMICEDEHLGKSYRYDSLVTQLENRMKYGQCVNAVIRKAGVIVSHFATFAVAKDAAILSGMITRPQYRGRGYGSILVNDLSSMTVRSGRLPILYCYEDEYYTWYQKLGYTTISDATKLEIEY